MLIYSKNYYSDHKGGAFLFKTLLLLFFLLFVQTVVLALEKQDVSGPAIRFTNIEARDSKIFIEGFTFDEKFPVKAILYTIDKSLEALSNIEPVDGIYDSKNEKFIISIDFPSNSDWDMYVSIKVYNSVNESSSADVDIFKRKDRTGYFTYLSNSALSLNFIDCGDVFRIYYTPSIDKEAVEEAQKKLKAAKEMTDSNFNFKYPDKVYAVLYNPDKDEVPTYKNYRGTSRNGILTFPVEIRSLDEIKHYNYYLDSRMPHELGDLSVRNYLKDELSCLWFSEGFGDLTAYLFMKKYYRDDYKIRYQERIKSFKESNSNMKSINFLESKWYPDFYLCSSAFVADIYKEHGTEFFRKLFRKLNSFPVNGAEEKDLILIMSQILGKDINPVITDFSTDKAVKILENIDEK